MDREALKAVIAKIVSGRKIELIGDPIETPDAPGRFIQNIQIINADGTEKAFSSSSLKRINDLAHNSGINVSFLLVARDLDVVTSALRSQLKTHFAESIQSCDVVDGPGGVTVIISTTGAEAEHDNIRKAVSAFCKAINERVSTVTFIDADELPKPFAILNTIRRDSPIGLDDLIKTLVKRGHSIPSAQWLSYGLDGLRKRGLIERRSDGLYILTYGALRALGTQKEKRSPDVIRGLAMARRFK